MVLNLNNQNPTKPNKTILKHLNGLLSISFIYLLFPIKTLNIIKYNSFNQEFQHINSDI